MRFSAFSIATLLLLAVSIPATAQYSCVEIVDDDGNLWNSTIRLCDGTTIPVESAQLYRAYRGGMGRTPDVGGFNWWKEQIESGNHSMTTMLAGFIWSSEFLNIMGVAQVADIDHASFVDYIYRTVFGRAPDAGGFAWWVEQIDTGAKSLVDVLAEMTQSNEFVNATLVDTALFIADDPALVYLGPVGLNDTGITVGGNHPLGVNASCIGETIAQQDCSHGRDVVYNDASDGHAGFSFTKLAADGSELPPGADTWACVRDRHTTLVWEVKTDDGSIHDRNNTYRWGGTGAVPFGSEFHDDWNVLVDGSNNEALCGYSDWRVPRATELIGIVNFGMAKPAIDTDYFPNTVSPSRFWTSSVIANDSSEARQVFFDYGDAGAYDRGAALKVRLVRGGQ
jgi:hypothetical protein